MIHILKLDAKWFNDVITEKKKFELRKNDRDYRVGDTLILKEIEKTIDGNIEYTGRMIAAEITFILDSNDFPDGLQDGYAILSIEIIGWRRFEQ